MLESTQNNDLSIRFVKWDDSLGSLAPLDYTTQTRQVNAFVNNRDVAFFTVINGLIMDQNDYIQLQVRNNSGDSDITAEVGSFFRIQER